MLSRTPLFFADAMLGKLARWLRMLGYDTAYQRDILDQDLIRLVVYEGRWLLTRDGYLTKRKVLQSRFTFIHSDDIHNQIRQLRDEFQINLIIDDNTPSRCTTCNHLLAPLSHADAMPFVPIFVAKQYSRFVHCPKCKKVFWPGTHLARLQHQLQLLDTVSN